MVIWLTTKEPKIDENDHKSLKRAKNHQKGLTIVKHSHKWSKRAKKPTNLDFKKTGKNHNKQEIQDMGVALLSCHALLRKYLQLLNLKLYDWLSLSYWLRRSQHFKKEATNCLFIKKFIFNLLFNFPLFLNLHTLNWYIIHPAKSLPHTIYNL